MCLGKKFHHSELMKQNFDAAKSKPWNSLVEGDDDWAPMVLHLLLKSSISERSDWLNSQSRELPLSSNQIQSISKRSSSSSFDKDLDVWMFLSNEDGLGTAGAAAAGPRCFGFPGAATFLGDDATDLFPLPLLLAFAGHFRVGEGGKSKLTLWDFFSPLRPKL